ncbi:hypothetical protein [Stygiolobus caldivivus]|uniref:Uncharacterized protein n=1 Tax=Stygiolobus caldivivus TaxID=2824673 RepID=A0A8D5U4Q4_9CREN|nr:hypothetical protein [Stygiolobus caldivivus]BCU69244.1 hypothetical protein KN1_05410 [Stygiolobus caldivivus]
MKPLLLGIDGLSYSSFMKCNPRTLMMLFSSTFRGVVANKSKNTHPTPAWLSILEMTDDIPSTGFLTSLPDLKLIKITKAVAINIPITNPTYGEVKIPYDKSVSVTDELNKVKEAILENIDDSPVIADITALDRMLITDGNANKCLIYNEIDSFVKEIVNKIQDFIVFSIYGEPKGNKHEDYGIFLSTVPRPNEHDTVKLPELGILFSKLAKGEVFY